MKRVVVVSGASSGIGLCTAEKFAAMGDRVIMVSRRAEVLKKKRDELVAKGFDASYIPSDVAKPASVIELVKKIKESFGTCHILVNSAGVFRGGLLHMSTDEEYETLFSVNTMGTYNMMKHFIPLMLENKTNENSIVNISSLSGLNGDYNAALYCASKAAVLGMSRAAALDYADKGIRINVISPSVTATPMFFDGSTEKVIKAFEEALPSHKIGKPEQVADVVAFLCSQAAHNVIGNNITMDGGLSAWNGQPRQNKEQ